MKILVVNCGSSSLKYQLIDMETEEVMAKGYLERIGLEDSFLTHTVKGEKHRIEKKISNHEEGIKLVIEQLLDKDYGVIKNLSEIDAVGHRIVHGGEKFSKSVVITDEVENTIKECIPLAPLHNPAGITGIEACKKALKGVPMVAVFDTAFHQTLPKKAYMYAIPYEYYEKYGVRKYGAHGTSIRYTAPRAAKLLGKDLKDLKLVICHLGSGASITAVKDGKSYDTSMGFSPIAGITMATRTGDIDPSLVQHLMKVEHKSMDEMIYIMNNKSGLLGLSGISPDMRDVRESDSERAKLARKIFINRIIRYVGAYIAEMGGVDAIIFTAGIGEHDTGVRKAVLDAFAYMGVVVDNEANESVSEGLITKTDSKVAGMVIPTNEELMIERDVVRLTNID